MSDMSRPRSIPPAPDHEQHDPLLVAQLVARDRLPEDQQREAQRLVSTCGACADLAADLAAVSGAVAWEPVPPRRRDFRLDPEQAERLQGNAATRFLRRLSLPQARAFRPAAAGVMSIGLAFVVAGYVWPGDQGVSLVNESLTAPAAVEQDVAHSFAPVEMPPPALGDATADEVEMHATEPGIDAAVSEPARQQNLESRAKSVHGLADKADPEAPAGAAAEANMAEGLAEIAADEISESFAESASEESTWSQVPDAGEPNVVEPGTERPVEESAAYFSDVDAVQRGDGFPGLDATSEGETPDSQPVTAAPADEGLDMASMLLVTGVGMALIGALLLVMAWLSRRSSDPLLR